MKFALIGGSRALPSSGMTAKCPACGGSMIAKCGEQRVHHWAHRGKRLCDPWWEPETTWHRNWKNKFPAPWQEVICYNEQTTEKHIADVQTGHGLTIEFQHSHLNPLEREARERFYRNMIWVVDGSRLKRDWPKFVEGIRISRAFVEGLYLTRSPAEVFPRNWINCAAPVIFDFENAAGLSNDAAFLGSQLWCLLPGRAHDHAIMHCLPKNDFINSSQSSPNPLQTKSMIEAVRKLLDDKRIKNARRSMLPSGFQQWNWNKNSRRRTPRF